MNHKGYVRLVDKLGSDLSIVNAARVSYDKEKQIIDEKDVKLLRFLWKEGHTSPFRHAALTFEIYAPLMVARQWYKYAVASTHLDDQNGWNESSRRYVTENEEFYVPREWRSKPENSKQGSGDPIDLPEFTQKLIETIDNGVKLYHEAMEAGIAPEQARLFLPAYGMYVRWRWTISLHGLMHFLNQRLESDAQFEIREYAEEVKRQAVIAFPETFKIM
jgi:thymidylate synthase (FAD)